MINLLNNIDFFTHQNINNPDLLKGKVLFPTPRRDVMFFVETWTQCSINDIWN